MRWHLYLIFMHTLVFTACSESSATLIAEPEALSPWQDYPFGDKVAHKDGRIWMSAWDLVKTKYSGNLHLIPQVASVKLDWRALRTYYLTHLPQNVQWLSCDEILPSLPGIRSHGFAFCSEDFLVALVGLDAKEVYGADQIPVNIITNLR
jgi:hypothetical protein